LVRTGSRVQFPSPACEKATKMREIITLECTVCKNRNYTTTKNKKKHQDKLQLSKYCKFCHKHTPHKELK